MLWDNLWDNIDGMLESIWGFPWSWEYPFIAGWFMEIPIAMADDWGVPL